MFKNYMKNNKIGQNDVNDESINKKAKNVNSNENNSIMQNVNNFNGGTDWNKLLETLNNLEIEQNEKFSILSNCEVCSQNIYDKILELNDMKDKIFKEVEKSWLNDFIPYTGRNDLKQLDNIIHSTQLGINIKTSSNEHDLISKELRNLYIKIKNYRELKNKLLNI